MFDSVQNQKREIQEKPTSSMLIGFLMAADNLMRFNCILKLRVQMQLLVYLEIVIQVPMTYSVFIGFEFGHTLKQVSSRAL